MSMGPGPGPGPGSGAGAPSEAELRAAYEAEMKRVRIEHILLEHVVAMVNLGMRRTGLSPGTEDERDPDQVRLAIESVRALLPVLEQTAPEQLNQIRSALSQLQLAYVRVGGQAGAGAAGAGAGAGEAGAGPGGAGAAPSGGSPSGAPPSGAPPAGGVRPGGAPPGEPPPGGPGPGPAQRSGRLWVPGQ